MAAIKWKWQGGMLVSENESLTIAMAYHMIPQSREIARACKDVLIPYDKDLDKLMKKARKA